jgi:hypothetical protein
LAGDFVRNFCAEGKGVIGMDGIMIELMCVTDALRSLVVDTGKTTTELQEFVDGIIIGKA